MRVRLLVLLVAVAAFAVGCGAPEEAAPVAETVVGTLPEDLAEEATETGEEETETETETDTGTGEEETETGTETGEDGGGTDTTGSGDGEEQEDGDVAAGDPQAGEEVFAASGCGSCHALDAAGSEGTIGPNLDDAQPDYERAVDFITNGRGAMPAFKDQLSEEDIANVAAYVVESTKG